MSFAYIIWCDKALELINRKYLPEILTLITPIYGVKNDYKKRKITRTSLAR